MRKPPDLRSHPLPLDSEHGSTHVQGLTACTSLDPWRRRDPFRATGSPARGDPFARLKSSEQNGAGTKVHMYRCAGKALVAAGIAVRVFPSLSPPAERLVERVVTVALLCILFDGGMHPGVAAFPAVRDSDRGAGYRGHVPDRAAAAVLAHLAFGLDWYLAALLGTAVSTTDPALVFSVLGRREVAGRSGDILEGESGANEPVGIALMVALLAAGSIDPAAFPAGHFVLQLDVAVAGSPAGAHCCGSSAGSGWRRRGSIRCARWPVFS